MNYPIGKFVLDHSEDYDSGKTLVMSLGKGHDTYYEIDVLLWEVQEAEVFIIVDSKDKRTPYKGRLTKKEKRWAFKSLFIFGIRDDR